MIVLDAAALVDVVLDQPAKDWVLDQLVDEVVCAPAHQPAEVLSAIARLVRSDELDGDAAAHAVREARAAEQELVAPEVAHLERALALQDRIRVVDGLYVALAQSRDCPLVTTDRRLSRAQPPCEVRSAPAGSS